MPLSVGRWFSLPGALHTGNTATTHTDIFTCIGCNDFTSSPYTALTKGNETLLWTNAPPKILHIHNEESVAVADSVCWNRQGQHFYSDMAINNEMMHGWHIFTPLPSPLCSTALLSSPQQIPLYSCTNFHTLSKDTLAWPPKTPPPPVHFAVRRKFPLMLSLACLLTCMYLCERSDSRLTKSVCLLMTALKLFTHTIRNHLS